MSMQSFIVRLCGVYELLHQPLVGIILTNTIELLIAADTCHDKWLTHIFSYKLNNNTIYMKIE